MSLADKGIKNVNSTSGRTLIKSVKGVCVYVCVVIAAIHREPPQKKKRSMREQRMEVARR